jgi:hypothetical protein
LQEIRDMAMDVEDEDPVLRKLLDEVASGALGPSAALQSALEYVYQDGPRQAHDAATDRGLSLADTALGAGGLTERDPLIRELARFVAEGHMTGDKVVPFINALIGSGRAHTPAQPEAATLDARVGPFYDAAALLERLQVCSNTLAALVRTGDVLEVISSDGYPLFPAFQFGQDAQPLPQLRDVLVELDPGQVDPWGDAVWLNAPAKELEGVSPATALRRGRTEDVVRLARAAGSFRLG